MTASPANALPVGTPLRPAEWRLSSFPPSLDLPWAALALDVVGSETSARDTVRALAPSDLIDPARYPLAARAQGTVAQWLLDAAALLTPWPPALATQGGPREALARSAMSWSLAGLRFERFTTFLLDDLAARCPPGRDVPPSRDALLAAACAAVAAGGLAPPIFTGVQASLVVYAYGVGWDRRVDSLADLQVRLGLADASVDLATHRRLGVHFASLVATPAADAIADARRLLLLAFPDAQSAVLALPVPTLLELLSAGEAGPVARALNAHSDDMLALDAETIVAGAASALGGLRRANPA